MLGISSRTILKRPSSIACAANVLQIRKKSTHKLAPMRKVQVILEIFTDLYAPILTEAEIAMFHRMYPAIKRGTSWHNLQSRLQ